jgi:hypothetical protein
LPDYCAISPPSAARTEIELLHVRLAKLLENLPGIAYEFRPIANGSATFETSGKQVERIFGLHVDADLLSYEALILRVHATDLPALMASIALADRSERLWQCEFRACHRDRSIT